MINFKDIKNQLNINEVKTCFIGRECNVFYYVGTDEKDNIIVKIRIGNKLELETGKSSSHNLIGCRKRALKKFCLENSKNFNKYTISLNDNKIKYLDEFVSDKMVM